MSRNEISFEQTIVMRAAIQMGLDRDGDEGEGRRAEVARVVPSIANECDHDAATLASLTLERMAEMERSHRGIKLDPDQCPSMVDSYRAIPESVADHLDKRLLGGVGW